MKCPERTKRAGWSQHRGEEGRESLGGYNVKMCKRQKKFLDTATSTQNLQHMFIALLGVGIYQSQENFPFLTDGGQQCANTHIVCRKCDEEEATELLANAAR